MDIISSVGESGKNIFMKISVLVTLYNCRLTDSLTLNSLLDIKKCNEEIINLYIWNNGPFALDSEEIDKFIIKANLQGYEVVIHQDIRNIALSKIYNFFLDNIDSDFYCFLDHDSILPKPFFRKIVECKNCDLIIPLVFDREFHQNIYPMNNKFDTVIKEEGYIKADELMSIGSGIVLSARLVELFRKNYNRVFNENFALYGVDSMFFRSLWELSDKGNNLKIMCINQIIHSLSRYKNEILSVKENRKVEELYDFILVHLYYFGKTRYWVWKNIFKKYRRGDLSVLQLLKLANCIITKRHPRASLRIKN